MWQPDDVRIEIEEVEGRTVIAAVRTPVGVLRLIAEFELQGGVLWLRGAHIQGLTPGALGRGGLKAIAHKLLEETDARTLVVEGGVRTTGARPGRAPKRFRFPN